MALYTAVYIFFSFALFLFMVLAMIDSVVGLSLEESSVCPGSEEFSGSLAVARFSPWFSWVIWAIWIFIMFARFCVLSFVSFVFIG